MRERRKSLGCRARPSRRLATGIAEKVGRVGLALFAVLSAGAHAETLDSLIARHIEARGGRERLAEIRTVRMRGRATAGPGQEALVSREVRLPDRIRTEFVHQGVTSVYACDGSICWSVDPLSGSHEPEPMAEAEASREIEEVDILGPLVDWKAKGHSIELLGRETIDGRETFKVRVNLKSGAVQTDYLDAESALLVRRDSTETIGGRTVEVATTFSDFRPVSGVLFAHSIRITAKDHSDYLEVTVEEAELNPPLDDARFEMPR